MKTRRGKKNNPEKAIRKEQDAEKPKGRATNQGSISSPLEKRKRK